MLDCGCSKTHWPRAARIHDQEMCPASTAAPAARPAANGNGKHQDPLGVPYRPDPGLEKSSLSMRLMHRPSRAQMEFEKANDPTRKNSLLNSLSPDQDAPLSPSAAQTEQLLLSGAQDALEDTSSLASPTRAPHHNLVRKKSGEIVKSLLKDRTHSVGIRSRSLPSTPTFKQVHFGGDTDVRYFKKKDRPAAILAQNSPALYDDDDDDDAGGIPALEVEGDLRMRPLFNPNRTSYFEYYDDELNSRADREADSVQYKKNSSKLLPTPNDWFLAPRNFVPLEDPLQNIRKGKQVFLENIFLSSDKRYLLGQVAVRNLDFQKSVIVRYSVDNWSTIVEIQAVYIPDVPNVLKKHNYDRFMFKISLDLFVNGFLTNMDPLATAPSYLSSELCVKYRVRGQELWDNNEGNNYLFSLKKGADFKLQQKELPNSARTKQEAHEKKPKYSSSYLKKVKSDSSLFKHSIEPPANDFMHSKGHLSPEPSTIPNHLTNDYESNGFYLSSPLFSSFANKNIDPDLRGTTLHKTFEEKGHGGSLPSHSNSHRKQNYSAGSNYDVSHEFSPEADPLSLPRMTNNLQEPMSYRDFLDSYCFFNSKYHDNNSKTTLVMSDNPTSSDNGVANNDNAAGSDHVYSVSSFLT